MTDYKSINVNLTCITILKTIYKNEFLTNYYIFAHSNAMFFFDNGKWKLINYKNEIFSLTLIKETRVTNYF